MDTLEAVTIDKVIELVAADAELATKETRVYTMKFGDKARQGDVYLACCEPNAYIRNHYADSASSTSIEIAKSHVLSIADPKKEGIFKVVESGFTTFSEGSFVLYFWKETHLKLEHPEHAHHDITVPAESVLVVWSQRTMDKNSVGGRVRD